MKWNVLDVIAENSIAKMRNACLPGGCVTERMIVAITRTRRWDTAATPQTTADISASYYAARSSAANRESASPLTTPVMVSKTAQMALMKDLAVVSKIFEPLAVFLTSFQVR